MERFTIKNRHGLKLVIQVDTPANPESLVFISPGQGGFIEQKHIQVFTDAFLENNFRVVRFDPTHSSGDSEGKIEDVTYTSYTEDLEDVIKWARAQDWFSEPFALCGHSMGAQSTAWYAEHHSSEIKCVVPIAPVVNYDLYMETLDDDYKKDWQEKGYKEMASRSKPGVIKKIGWAVNESLKDYDLLPNVNKLTMPVLFMVGEFDRPCPYENQEIFFDLIPSKNKKIIKIEGVEHSFRNPDGSYSDEKLIEVKDAISDWLKDEVSKQIMTIKLN